MDNYDIAIRQLLITVFKQIPCNSILAIDMQTSNFEESDAYKIINTFRIQDDFSTDCCFPNYYFLITEKNREQYIKAIHEYLESYLCHYTIFKRNKHRNEIWVSVLDSCLFSIISEIKITDELKQMCNSEGIYIDITTKNYHMNELI